MAVSPPDILLTLSCPSVPKHAEIQHPLFLLPPPPSPSLIILQRSTACSTRQWAPRLTDRLWCSGRKPLWRLSTHPTTRRWRPSARSRCMAGAATLAAAARVANSGVFNHIIAYPTALRMYVSSILTGIASRPTHLCQCLAVVSHCTEPPPQPPFSTQ